jgi:hypothetical protein
MVRRDDHKKVLQEFNDAEKMMRSTSPESGDLNRRKRRRRGGGKEVSARDQQAARSGSTKWGRRQKSEKFSPKLIFVNWMARDQEASPIGDGNFLQTPQLHFGGGDPPPDTKG